MRRICIALAVLVALAACGGDDDSGLVGANTTATTEATPLPTCASLIGTPTDDLVANALCIDEAGGQQLLTFASYTCPDGRKLMWNDYGWGYSGDVWQAHARADGQLVPPDEDMAACS